MNKRKAGIVIISASLVLFVFDRMTYFFSTLLGKAVCGSSYLKATGPVFGENACGFDMDMNFVVLCFLFIVSGLILFFIPTVQQRIKK